MKLRAAIIGCGGISRCHMAGYKALSDRVDVVACCDIDLPKAKRYAEEFGIPADAVYEDYNEMMAKETLDLVSVTTWNAAHCGATIAALKGGANVICEKPMAMNAIEAQAMLDTGKETGKVLQVGFVRRFGGDADTVLAFSKAGALGDIYYAKATYLRRSGFPGGWFGDLAYSGGGPLIDLGVHVMDLVRYLSGLPKPVQAFGVTYKNLGNNRASGGEQAWAASTAASKYKYDVEDFTSAMIRFDSGLTMLMEASFNLNIAHDTGNIELMGTKGGLSFSPKFEIYTDMAGRFINIAPQGNTGFDFTRAFNDEIRGFVDAAEGKAPCRAPAEDGVILMKMIDAIYESARTGKAVDII